MPASAAGSMARKAWPSRAGSPSSSNSDSVSKPNRAPERLHTSSSTISASMVPLAPAAGSMVPARPARGSVVGRPSASSAQPSGMDSPSRAAIISWPRVASPGARLISSGAAAREGRRDRVGAQQRPPAAPGRHGRRGVAEGQAHQAGRGDGLQVVGGGAEMMAVGHRHECHAVLARPFDGQRGRQRAGRIGQARTRVDQRRAAVLARQPGPGGALGAPHAQVGGVAGHARHALRHQALAVGVHQGARRALGHVGVGARRRQRGGGQVLQFVQVDMGHRKVPETRRVAAGIADIDAATNIGFRPVLELRTLFGADLPDPLAGASYKSS
ncbi:hypothetical protein BOPE631_17895 [Bordetella pertussis]